MIAAHVKSLTGARMNTVAVKHPVLSDGRRSCKVTHWWLNDGRGAQAPCLDPTTAARNSTPALTQSLSNCRHLISPASSKATRRGEEKKIPMARELSAFIRWPPLHIPAADVKSLTGGKWMNVVRKIRCGPSPQTPTPEIIISLFNPCLRCDLA